MTKFIPGRRHSSVAAGRGVKWHRVIEGTNLAKWSQREAWQQGAWAAVAEETWLQVHGPALKDKTILWRGKSQPVYEVFTSSLQELGVKQLPTLQSVWMPIFSCMSTAHWICILFSQTVVFNESKVEGTNTQLSQVITLKAKMLSWIFSSHLLLFIDCFPLIWPPFIFYILLPILFLLLCSSKSE